MNYIHIKMIKMTKNELTTNHNINNYKNNIMGSQGHQKLLNKKDINEINLRVSTNDNIKLKYYQKQQMKQNKINLLKKDLESKPNNLINKSNPQGLWKYNGNILYNYNNNNNNNRNNYNISRGFYEINEVKEYKKNDTKRNKTK